MTLDHHHPCCSRTEAVLNDGKTGTLHKQIQEAELERDDLMGTMASERMRLFLNKKIIFIYSLSHKKKEINLLLDCKQLLTQNFY